MTNEKKPEETTTKQKMITISPVCVVPEEDYRVVSEATLETMSTWVNMATNDRQAKILLDLRDAVFERSGKRLNGLGK